MISTGAAPDAPIGVRDDILTVEVTEDFLLLDPSTGLHKPVAHQVTAALPEPFRQQARLGRCHSTLEMVTPPCTDLAILR
jgi:carboxylate-amine ligase